MRTPTMLAQTGRPRGRNDPARRRRRRRAMWRAGCLARAP